MQLFYVWGHSYEFDVDNNWKLIEIFCEKIGNQDTIWYATNIEIVEYVNALKNLKMTSKGNIFYNPSSTPVWIENVKKLIKINAGETRRL